MVRPTASRLNIVRAQEIVEKDLDIRWLVKDRLIAGGLSLLVGKPKSGKTVMARYLAYCVSTGAPFAEAMPVTQGPVLYISLEDGQDLVKHQLQAMGAGHAPIGFVFSKSDPDLAKAIHHTASHMKQPPVLIVVDTLQRLLLANDLNSYSEMTIAMEPIMSLSRETGAHVVCVHHARKGWNHEAVDDSILGSQALMGSVDAALLIRRYPEYRTLESLQRFGEDLDETVIQLDRTTMQLRLKGARRDYQEQLWERKILKAIADGEGYVFQKDIPGICMTEGKDEAVRLGNVLRRMLRSGRLFKSGQGGRRDPYRYTVKPVPKSQPLDPEQVHLDF